MHGNKLKTRAQNLAEYSVIFGLVVASIITIRIYMMRGYQAVMQRATDEAGIQSSTVVKDEYYPLTTDNYAMEGASSLIIERDNFDGEGGFWKTFGPDPANPSWTIPGPQSVGWSSHGNTKTISLWTYDDEVNYYLNK